MHCQYVPQRKYLRVIMRTIEEYRFFSIRKAALAYRVAPVRIRAAIESGDLVASRHGLRWFSIYEPDLIAWLKRDRIRPVGNIAEKAMRRRRLDQVLRGEKCKQKADTRE